MEKRIIQGASQAALGDAEDFPVGVDDLISGTTMVNRFRNYDADWLQLILDANAVSSICEKDL